MSTRLIALAPMTTLMLSALELVAYVFADGMPDGLSGGAGWTGVGLLGAVLSWVFFVHLPSKDKQLERIIAANDARFDKQGQDHRDLIVTLSADWKAGLEMAHDHCKEEIERIIALNRGKP